MKIDMVKTFYERTLEVLVFNLPLIGHSELKLLLVINRITLSENFGSVALRIEDFIKITGMSRKTVIDGMKRLKDLSLIYVDKKDKPYKYSINRHEVLKISQIESQSYKEYNRIVSDTSLVEEVNFNRSELPPLGLKLTKLWNQYMSLYLDFNVELHKKCIQSTINKHSNTLIGIENYICDNVDLLYSNNDLYEVFGIKEE
tara:strand:- start:2632 stop:3234 length:603 start_codon:yes stop_codon:yes gene_type:complete